MPGRPTTALPQLLRLLSMHPAPNDLARALARGVLARYDALSTVIWVSLGDHSLEVIGDYGAADGTIDRYGAIPLAADTPVTVAWREQSVVWGDLAGIAGRFPILALDPQFWTEADPAVHGRTVVTAPILIQSHAIGAWGFTSLTDLELDETDLDYLLGLSHILGIWLSHPDTTVPPSRSPDAAALPSLQLTDRQQRILTAILNGRSNAEIAADLGYSESTIKQDTYRAMAAMQTSERTIAAERAWELGLIDAPRRASGTDSIRP